MRTFKKDNRIEKTNDKFIIDALLSSGFKEVEPKPKAVEDIEEETEEAPKKGRRRGE